MKSEMLLEESCPITAIKEILIEVFEEDTGVEE
jgi:hypothetical protein